MEDNSNEAESEPATKIIPVRLSSHEDGSLYSGGSYKSNLFKLQVDELLAEVKPNYEKRLGFVDEELRKLKVLIESIEDRDPLSVSKHDNVSILYAKILLEGPRCREGP